MKFMLLVRVEPGVGPSPDEDSDPTPWWEDANARGMYLAGGPLQGTSDATTVSVRDGSTLITDGPFAEFKEHIAGYDLVEAADLAEAVELAQGHPVTRFGSIEVRQIWEDWQPDEDTHEQAMVSDAPAAGRRRYVMLHAEPEPSVTPPSGAEHGLREWTDEFDPTGALLIGDRLRPSSEAATVRVRDGKPLVVHGPYAEMHEQVAGFDLIEVTDLDEAIDIAAKHPTARLSAIEIRPLGTL